ncbi:MAG: hypothetical protein JW966_14205 [Anaerolineae bacterium]|nr:hypothetical protein [Anaerolineae bacterium]
MHYSMIMVCHAADGYFADGNREGVRRVLNQTTRVGQVLPLGHDHYQIVYTNGGTLELRACGLGGGRSFHYIEVCLTSASWTGDMLTLIFNLMKAGGFGLLDSLDSHQIIITAPEQIVYFPWLPEPPRVVRSPHELAHVVGLVTAAA